MVTAVHGICQVRYSGNMRKHPERTIRLVRPPDEHGIGIFAITERGRTQHYIYREIPCEIGGRGFALHKLGLGQLYHVRVGDPSQCSCECLGFLRHGRCKHVLGLMALLQSRNTIINSDATNP